MTKTEDEIAVAEFLRKKGVTRCPTVCAVPTQAEVDESDRAAYREIVATREAAWLEKRRTLQQMYRF